MVFSDENNFRSVPSGTPQFFIFHSSFLIHKKVPVSGWKRVFFVDLADGGLDVPDLGGVLTNGTVGGELGGGGHIDQALAAEGQTVSILGVGAELGIDVAGVVLQDIVLIGGGAPVDQLELRQ